jgi:hypothetical protein
MMRSLAALRQPAEALKTNEARTRPSAAGAMRYSCVTLPHTSTATPTSSGAATGSIGVGCYASGHLLVRVCSPAGAGVFMAPDWQRPAGGMGSLGDLTRGRTMSAMGTRMIALVSGVGNVARCRWTQGETGLQGSAIFTVKE